MKPIKLYDKLEVEPTDTIEVDGYVLSFENNGKYHVCKSGARRVAFACGASAPTDPHVYDYAKGRLEKNGSVDTPAEALERPAICKNCHTIMEKEFDLERVIVAVPPEDSTMDQQTLGSDAKTVEEQAIERFVEQWSDG